MKKYIYTLAVSSLLVCSSSFAAKQSLQTVGETTHGDVRTTVNTNATRANSNFTELYNRNQTGVSDWLFNGTGHTYAADDLVKYGDKIYIALGAHEQGATTPDNSVDFEEWGGGGSGAVSSVNTFTGDVVLDADDISDTTTTNKFVTAADKTKLSNLSGTNTGDQDLSGLATKANVLQLNNTTPFTPDADYEPATKKFVDDSITAGGGYTDEQAQDAVGGMVSSNTETGISVTYDDDTAKMNFVVASQTDNNFTTALKNKLDGIAESADVDTDDQTASEVTAATTNFNGNLTVTENTVQKALDKIDDLSIGGTYTDEQAQDAVGGMLSGNTETGIAVTYDDATAKINFVVDDDLQDLSDGTISASKVTPPGSDTQVIFNNASAFAGDSGMTFTPATDALTVAGSITTPSFVLGGTDGSKKLPFPENTSITATAGEEAIYNEAGQMKVTEGGTEYSLLHSGDIGVTVQAYNQYLPTWPSSVNNTEVSYLDGVTSSIQTQLTGKEASLGNPSVTGYVLSSTSAGVRSWVAAGGMVYPGAGIPNSTGSAWGSSYALDADLSTVSASDDTIPSAKATKALVDGLPTLAAGTGITITEDGGGAGIDTINVTTNTYQAYDADLTTWAGITPGSGVGTFLATPTSANLASAVTGETGSGALVFDTSPVFSTSVALPQGASPTVDAAGETAIDTTSDQLIYYGGAKRVLTYKKQIDFAVKTPVDADDFLLFKAQTAMTITDIHVIAQGGTSISVDIQECTSAGASCATVDAAITADTDGAEDDGTLSNGTIDAGDWVKVVLGAPSGTVNYLAGSIYYVETAD